MLEGLLSGTKETKRLFVQEEKKTTKVLKINSKGETGVCGRNNLI